jgi:hypothetical protein
MNAPDWAALESIRDANRYSAMCEAGERQAAAEAEIARQFTRSIEIGDPDATPEWTGTVRDYQAAKRMGIKHDAIGYPHRRCFVFEGFQEALDHTNGPDNGDVVKLLSLAMRSTDEAVYQAARDLVNRAALSYAKYNTPEIEE